MPDNRLPVLRSDLAGVGELDLVMEAGGRKVVLVAVFLQETVHQRDRCRFVIVRADMQDLQAIPQGRLIVYTFVRIGFVSERRMH